MNASLTHERSSEGMGTTSAVTPKGSGDGFATKREVAEFLRVTTRTVEAYQRLGLPHLRLGPRRNRYDLAAVRRWLEGRQ